MSSINIIPLAHEQLILGNSHASYIKNSSVKFSIGTKTKRILLRIQFPLTITASKGMTVYKTMKEFSYKSFNNLIMNRTMNISKKIHNIHSRRKSANATAIFFVPHQESENPHFDRIARKKIKKRKKANVAIVVSTRVDSFCVIKMINFGFFAPVNSEIL
jgi:hypothetical protein